MQFYLYNDNANTDRTMYIDSFVDSFLHKTEVAYYTGMKIKYARPTHRQNKAISSNS